MKIPNVPRNKIMKYTIAIHPVGKPKPITGAGGST